MPVKGLFAGFVFIACACSAAAVTVTCNNNSGDQALLQNALSAGGTIALSGTCMINSAQLTMGSNTTLQGNGNPTINYTWSGSAIGSYGNNNTITGIIFNGGGLFLGDAGSHRISGWTITNNTFRNITNGSDGIAADPIVIGATITGNTFFNIWAGGYPNVPGGGNVAGAGIHGFAGWDTSLIDSNTFDETGDDGMHLAWNYAAGDPPWRMNTAGLTVSNNTITHCHRIGIEMQGTTNYPGACGGGHCSNSNYASNDVVKSNYIHNPGANGFMQGDFYAFSVPNGGINMSIYNNTTATEVSACVFRPGIAFELGQNPGLVQGNVASDISAAGGGCGWAAYITVLLQGTMTFNNNLMCGPGGGGGAGSQRLGGVGTHIETGDYYANSCPFDPQEAVSNISEAFTSSNNQNFPSGGNGTWTTSVISNLSIRYMKFFVDGSSTPSVTQELQDVNRNFASDRKWLYHATISTNGLAQGNHTITATATDVSGASQSVTQNFTVGSGGPPAQQWSLGFYNSQTGAGGYPISSLNGVWGGLTHLSVYGLNPNADGTLTEGDSNPSVAYPAIISAAHANGVKVLLNINATPNWTSATNPTHLSTFVSGIMSVVNTYGFDGVDLDWEQTAVNFTQMGNLLTSLRAQLGTRLINADAVISDIPGWAGVQSNLDRISVMTYDLGGSTTYTWFNSGINLDPGNPGGQLGWDLTRQRLQSNGIPLTKANLGIPFYGELQTGATGPRQSVASISISQVHYADTIATYASFLAGQHRDAVAVMPWFSPSGNSWMNYDDPTSVTAKVNYAKSYGLGWIMFNLSGDYVSTATPQHPLLAAVQAAMGTSGSGLGIPVDFFGMHMDVGPTNGATPVLPPMVVGAHAKGAVTDWEYSETSRGTYNWGALDSTVLQAKTANVPYFQSHQGVARFATSDASTCGVNGFSANECSAAPSDLHISAACQGPLTGTTTTDCMWKEFLTTMVQRYKSTGIQTGCTSGNPQCHGVIQMYEGWNEPPYPTPMAIADFVTFETDFVTTVRANDPNAKVGSPAFINDPRFPSELAFADTFFANGGPTTYDSYDFHMNAAQPEDQIALVNAYKTILSNHGITNPVLYSTELGRWGSCGVDGGSISNVAIAGNVLTITVSSPSRPISQVLAPTMQVSFSGLATATFLNGQTITVTAVTSSTFTGSFTHADYGPTADSGTASVSVSDTYKQGYIGRIEPIYWANGIKRHYWYAYSTCGKLSNQPTTNTLTPSGIAYGTIEGWMIGATMGPLSMNGSSDTANATFTSTLTDSAGHANILAWRSGTPTSLAVPSNYTSYLDINGASHPITSQSVLLSSTPVLIKTDSVLSAPQITSFTATPSTISSGGNSTLAWSTLGATILSINQGVGTVTGTTSATVTPTVTTTYILTATNSVGSASQSVTVTIAASGTPLISSFTANPGTISAGGVSTLSWVTSGATTLTISPGVGDVTGNTGQTLRTVSPEPGLQFGRIPLGSPLSINQFGDYVGAMGSSPYPGPALPFLKMIDVLMTSWTGTGADHPNSGDFIPSGSVSTHFIKVNGGQTAIILGNTNYFCYNLADPALQSYFFDTFFPTVYLNHYGPNFLNGVPVDAAHPTFVTMDGFSTDYGYCVAPDGSTPTWDAGYDQTRAQWYIDEDKYFAYAVAHAPEIRLTPHIGSMEDDSYATFAALYKHVPAIEKEPYTIYTLNTVGYQQLYAQFINLARFANDPVAFPPLFTQGGEPATRRVFWGVWLASGDNSLANIENAFAQYAMVRGPATNFDILHRDTGQTPIDPALWLPTAQWIGNGTDLPTSVPGTGTAQNSVLVRHFGNSQTGNGGIAFVNMTGTTQTVAVPVGATDFSGQNAVGTSISIPSNRGRVLRLPSGGTIGGGGGSGSGSIGVSPAATTTYVLNACNNAGCTQASTTVTVTLGGGDGGGSCGTHPYWRVYGTLASNGDNDISNPLSSSELQFHGVPGGPQIAVGGTALASSTYSGYPASNAFDGNTATLWSAASGANVPQWLAYQFATPVNVSEFTWRDRGDSYPPWQDPRAGTLDWSDDGSAWTSAGSFTFPSWSSGESKTFTLNGGGGACVPVINSFTANPTTITLGASSTLAWNVSGATALAIDQGVGTVTGLNSISVSPTVDTTYTLTASTSTGNATQTVTVHVLIGGGGTTPLITSFTATPTTIAPGASSQLAWTVTGATSISIDQGVGIVTNLSSTLVSPAVTTTYVLSATNAHGTVSQSVTVTVNVGGAAPAILSFIATPSIILSGGASTLSWITNGGETSLSIDNGIGSVLGTTSFVVHPTVTTVYTLTAANASGSVAKVATVTIAVACAM